MALWKATKDLGDVQKPDICRSVWEGRLTEAETWHLSQMFTVRELWRSLRAKTLRWAFHPVLLKFALDRSLQSSPTVEIYNDDISTLSIDICQADINWIWKFGEDFTGRQDDGCYSMKNKVISKHADLFNAVTICKENRSWCNTYQKGL